MVYSNLLSVVVTSVGSRRLVIGSRFRPCTSPSSTGAIISSKVSRGIRMLISSSLRRVVLVEGRTSFLTVVQKGSKNQLAGNDSRGTGGTGYRGCRREEIGTCRLLGLWWCQTCQ